MTSYALREPLSPRRSATTLSHLTTYQERSNSNDSKSRSTPKGYQGADDEAAIARLSSQHIASDYNLGRRQTQQFRANLNPARVLSTTQKRGLGGARPPANEKRQLVKQDVFMRDEPTPPPKRSIEVETDYLAKMEGEAMIEEDAEKTPTKRAATPMPMPMGLPGVFTSPLTPPKIPDVLPKGCKTSATHPLNFSAIVDPSLLSVFAWYLMGPPPTAATSLMTRSYPAIIPSSPTRGGFGSRARLPVSNTRSEPAMMMAADPKVIDGPFYLEQHALHPGHAPLDMWYLTRPSVRPNTTHSLWTVPLASATLPLSSVQQPSMTAIKPLGNLVLSSCPGKKVRLDSTSPRGARSAICRDFRADIIQAKEHAGIKAIICCLNNEELAGLGVPWEEYEGVATELGVKVYRLPMLEGFGPAGGNEDLDELLTEIVIRHTLVGEAVLCSCRGGIGRAGLVACGWLLKMGLVPNATLDPMTAVERVIEVVRRRRSIKAIETPQQVRALLDYILFLRNDAEAVKADDVLTSNLI